VRPFLLRLACPLFAVTLVSCPKGMPQHMVLELGEKKAPIRSVLVLRDSSRPSGENVSIVFHEDELDCAVAGDGGAARGATLAVRGLGPEFGRDERKPPLWSLRGSPDGAETAFAFGDSSAKDGGGGGRHALRVTRSGKTTAYGEIDLDVEADGVRHRLTGTFDAAICY